MILEGIGRVVGGAKEHDARLANEVLCAHVSLSKLCRCDRPDLVAVCLADLKLAIKISLKLKMAPMINGVTDQLGHDRAKCLESVIIRGIARDVLLVHAARAHGSPLIVVAVQPHLCDVGIALILGDLLGGKVTVIVNDGERFRVVMVKHLRGLRGKKEIRIHKFFHKQFSLSVLNSSTV